MPSNLQVNGTSNPIAGGAGRGKQRERRQGMKAKNTKTRELLGTAAAVILAFAGTSSVQAQKTLTLRRFKGLKSGSSTQAAPKPPSAHVAMPKTPPLPEGQQKVKFGNLGKQAALKMLKNLKPIRITSSGITKRDSKAVTKSAHMNVMNPAYRDGVSLYVAAPTDYRHHTYSRVFYYHVSLAPSYVRQLSNYFRHPYTENAKRFGVLHYLPKSQWGVIARAFFQGLGNQRRLFLLKIASSIPKNAICLRVGGRSIPRANLRYNSSTHEYVTLLELLPHSGRISVDIYAMRNYRRSATLYTGPITLQAVE